MFFYLIKLSLFIHLLCNPKRQIIMFLSSENLSNPIVNILKLNSRVLLLNKINKYTQLCQSLNKQL